MRPVTRAVCDGCIHDVGSWRDRRLANRHRVHVCTWGGDYAILAHTRHLKQCQGLPRWPSDNDTALRLHETTVLCLAWWNATLVVTWHCIRHGGQGCVVKRHSPHLFDEQGVYGYVQCVNQSDGHDMDNADRLAWCALYTPAAPGASQVLRGVNKGVICSRASAGCNVELPLGRSVSNILEEFSLLIVSHIQGSKCTKEITNCLQWHLPLHAHIS